MRPGLPWLVVANASTRAVDEMKWGSSASSTMPSSKSRHRTGNIAASIRIVPSGPFTVTPSRARAPAPEGLA